MPRTRPAPRSAPLTTLNLNKALIKAVTTLIASGAHIATAILTPTCTVRVARRAFKGRFGKGPLELVVTIGKPNHRARRCIALAQKVQEPFPIARVQLQFLAPRKPQARAARRSR